MLLSSQVATQNNATTVKHTQPRNQGALRFSTLQFKLSKVLLIDSPGCEVEAYYTIRSELLLTLSGLAFSVDRQARGGGLRGPDAKNQS